MSKPCPDCHPFTDCPTPMLCEQHRRRTSAPSEKRLTDRCIHGVGLAVPCEECDKSAPSAAAATCLCLSFPRACPVHGTSARSSARRTCWNCNGSGWISRNIECESCNADRSKPQSSPAPAGGVKAFPKTRGLLLSIALRMDHGLLAPLSGLETVPDGFTPESWRARKIEVALDDAERAYEEITGSGFYRPESDEDYRAMENEGMSAGTLFQIAKPKAASPVSATPVITGIDVAMDAVRDAERYRFMRSKLCNRESLDFHRTPTALNLGGLATIEPGEIDEAVDHLRATDRTAHPK